MSERMPEPDALAEEVDDSRGTGSGDAAEIGLETPDVDAMEQHTLAAEETPAGASGPRVGAAFDMKEVDEADAADQERIVDFDEDDYR